MTKNSINSNIPIEIAKGGTNAISMANTDGVCYFDGTRLVTTSVGVSGQVLTSNGAAVAPTFQVSPVLVVKKKLTSAQIKTIHTPLLLIAAHGANGAPGVRSNIRINRPIRRRNMPRSSSGSPPIPPPVRRSPWRRWRRTMPSG